MDKLIRVGRTWFFAVGIVQLASICAVMYLAYQLNFSGTEVNFGNESSRNFWLNTCLIGLLGSLLYFSRKLYVYLMSDKLGRIVSSVRAESKGKSLSDEEFEAKISMKIQGYCLYSAVRPIGGIAIGPITAMILLGGLSTFSKSAQSQGSSLSTAGVYLVYLFSFVGGYASSDLFEKLGKLGASILRGRGS